MLGWHYLLCRFQRSLKLRIALLTRDNASIAAFFFGGGAWAVYNMEGETNVLNLPSAIFSFLIILLDLELNMTTTNFWSVTSVK